ncbi:Uncharacterized protein Y057_8419 [Fusarium fujikuroi]|nr:Uncharacterized protein Y057_8419 [Fusarium fujikuroi]
MRSISRFRCRNSLGPKAHIGARWINVWLETWRELIFSPGSGQRGDGWLRRGMQQTELRLENRQYSGVQNGRFKATAGLVPSKKACPVSQVGSCQKPGRYVGFDVPCHLPYLKLSRHECFFIVLGKHYVPCSSYLACSISRMGRLALVKPTKQRQRREKLVGSWEHREKGNARLVGERPGAEDDHSPK